MFWVWRGFGCRRPCYALFPCCPYLAFNSFVALSVPSYVLLYGLGLDVVCAGDLFRDVMHLWSVVITAWMYLTPIFWTSDYIGKMDHWIQVLVVVNPMYNYLQFMRDIFLFNTVPSALTLGLCVVWAAIALVAGYTVFHKTEYKFILYI